MKKFTKICMWTALACFLLGLILVSVSWSMGFRGWRAYSVRRELETHREIMEGDIRNLSFHVEAGSLYVEEGDDFAITASSVGSNIDSRVENGTWVIEAEQPDYAGGSSIGGLYVDNKGIYLKGELGEVHVTVPREAKLKKVEINVDAGAVTMDSFQCEELDIDVDAGSVEFSHADVRKNVDIDVDTGAVSGTLEGREEEFTVEMDCDLGSIVAGSYELGGIAMGYDCYSGGEKRMTLSCDVGSIDLAFLEDTGE